MNPVSTGILFFCMCLRKKYRLARSPHARTAREEELIARELLARQEVIDVYLEEKRAAAKKK